MFVKDLPHSIPETRRIITPLLTLLLVYLASIPAITRSEFNSDEAKCGETTDSILQLTEEAGRRGSNDDYEGAIKILLQAMCKLDSTKPIDGSPPKWSHELDQAEILRRLGILYYAKGDYKNAEKFYQQSMQVKENSYVKRGLPFDVAEQYDFLRRALIYEAEGKTAQARSDFIRANAQMDRLFYDEMFENANEDGKLSEEQIFVADATNMTLSFHLRLDRQNPRSAALALETVLRRKGRVLISATSNREALLRFVRPGDRPLLDQYLAAREHHRDLEDTPKNANNAAQVIKETYEAEKTRDDLAKQLDDRIKYFYHDWLPLELGRFQSKLGDDEAWIEFVSYYQFNEKAVRNSERWLPRHYAACVLRRNGSPHWEDLGDAQTVDMYMSALHNDFQNEFGADVLKDDSHAVYHLLFDKLEPYLKGTRTWFISPDGSLNIIPFGALLANNEHYLIEDYQIRYMNSGLDFMRAQFPSLSGSPPLVLASPDFNIVLPDGEGEKPPSQCCESCKYRTKSWEPPPFMNDLASHIKSSFPASDVGSGGSASKTFLSKIEGPGFLAFATHGFYFPPEGEGGRPSADDLLNSDDRKLQRAIWMRLFTDPAGKLVQSGRDAYLFCSGVALAGANNHLSRNCDYGVLTAQNVYRLNLWGTQLVVLAACETGLGGQSVGEGIYGLRRAFFISGAESQTLSLWVVNAEATEHLLSSYFDYLHKGIGRAEALRKAQLDMLRGTNERWKTPYFWAGFIESGAWTPLTPSNFGG